MTTNSTQATGSANTKTVKAVKEVLKAEGAKADAPLPTLAGEAIAEAMKRFGKATVEKAAVAALTAIRDVQSGDAGIQKLEGEILLKREGNAQILFKLAKECVKLTMEGKTANLKNAADLMQVSCEFAEADTVSAYRAAHNGLEYKVRQIVPSWPVLKSDMINAMKKASINPADFPMATKVRNAYKEWKEKNPGDVDTRGAKSRATDKNGVVPAAAKADAKEIAKLSDAARNALMALTGAVQRAPAEKQPEVVAWVDELTKRIMSLTPSEEGSQDGLKAKARPIPAKVPDSNQIAQ